MIDQKDIISNLKQDLKKSGNFCIICKSFKKDRIIKIYVFNDYYQVIQDGHLKQEYNILKTNDNELIKLIKKLIKIEFNTCNKIWYSINKNN